MNDAARPLDEIIRARIAEARSRIDSVEEGHRRWNRVEEAMEAACEEAVDLLDNVGRVDQATDVNSHMSAPERYEILLKLFRDEADALAAEADAQGCARDFALAKGLLEALEPVVQDEAKHRGSR